MRTFTARELLDSAREAGAGELTAEEFRVLLHRKRFPAAPYGTGTRMDPHRWGEDALQRLLDHCFLRGQNHRWKAIELGLWLHGYPVDNPASLLVEQLEDIQRLVMGRSFSAGEVLTEEELDVVNEAVQTALEESVVLSDLVRGEYPGFHLVEWADYEELLGRPAEELRGFPYPHIDSKNPDTVVYPSRTLPEKVRSVLEIDAVRKRLNVLLGLNDADDWDDKELPEGGPYWSLPVLIRLLKSASLETLERARWSAGGELLWLFEDFDAASRTAPPYAALDVRSMLKQCGGDTRHLFAMPALFPVMALLIATGLHDHSSENRATRNLNLLALAVKRLYQRPERRPQKRDALLTLICAFSPAYTPDPRAVEALKRHQAQLRKR